MSDSVRPHRWQPTRLPSPWDSPGKNTGVGCHCLLQCMKVKRESEVAQSYQTLSDPMDCSPPGSSAHGIFQARVLEWGAIAFSEVYLRSPFYRRVGKSTERLRNLPEITQTGFKSRQSLVSESTLLIVDESVFIPWLFIMWAQPPCPIFLANTSYKTNLALLPLWILSSPPVK